MSLKTRSSVEEKEIGFGGWGICDRYSLSLKALGTCRSIKKSKQAQSKQAKEAQARDRITRPRKAQAMLNPVCLTSSGHSKAASRPFLIPDGHSLLRQAAVAVSGLKR